MLAAVIHSQLFFLKNALVEVACAECMALESGRVEIAAWQLATGQLEGCVGWGLKETWGCQVNRASNLLQVLSPQVPSKVTDHSEIRCCLGWAHRLP